jgi:SAM-dependent methyltransferase
MDPLAGSSWSTPSTVAGFSQSPPNESLLAFAERERRHAALHRAVDIGCGAARNAAALAAAGWDIVGTDLSWPMLAAAATRVRHEAPAAHVLFALAPMDALPVANRSADLVIAHGIWNLARSAAEFRSGVREAARIARGGAALFVFTFSRHTLPEEAEPLAGEPFVFTQFSGQPQCFLTEAQLLSELRHAGFDPDPAVPLRELNLPRPGALQSCRAPVIYEGTFRRRLV